MKILNQKLTSSRVAVVMETSSRSKRRNALLREYIDNGEIQNILCEIFSFASQLNQKKMEIFINESICVELEEMNSENCSTFVEKKVKKKMGEIFYEKQVPKAYYKAVNRVNCNSNDGKYPTIAFVMSVDDISRFNKRDMELTEEALEKTAEGDIFYVFIGIGNSSFRNLKKIVARFQNAGFIEIRGLRKVSTDKIMESTSELWVPWLKQKGFLE